MLKRVTAVTVRRPPAGPALHFSRRPFFTLSSDNHLPRTRVSIRRHGKDYYVTGIPAIKRYVELFIDFLKRGAARAELLHVRVLAAG